MRPGKRRTQDKAKPIEALTEQLERFKAGIRARVEHPFRVLKRRFGHVKVRYQGLAKNTRSCTRCLRWHECVRSTAKRFCRRPIRGGGLAKSGETNQGSITFPSDQRIRTPSRVLCRPSLTRLPARVSNQ